MGGNVGKECVDMKKLIIFIALSLIVLVAGIVALRVIFTPKPIPLSPTSRLEVKIAEKEQLEGLTPVNLEYLRGETLYVRDKAELSTSDVAGVYMSEDQMDRSAIMVVLTKAGRERMWSMSSANIDRHVVIFVNGQAVCAPMIDSPIRTKFMICPSGEKGADELFRALTQP
jgi:preprotein translocase subunit SecD